uniref:uncharacterized protein LOC124065341 n=1 Tax=Scatophagus argus TaxID=75038 RepID=UPI001ED7D9FD|nr:uncharacterized protein LOC124065341 [Scatophagus argus]
MDSSKQGSFYLRSTSALSLNERFSQVLLEQVTRSRMVTFDPVLLQQRNVCRPSPPVVLLVKGETPSLPVVQTRDSSSSVRLKRRPRRRRSVWTRLGWQRATRRLSASRPRGFWSFRNKYRWRAGFACRRPGHLRRRLGRRLLLARRNVQKVTAGRTRLSGHLQRGGATAYRRRGLSRADAPTKKQLDAQLDDYMSMSKSRLDKELDDYMSMSRRCLDAQLDEYMSMAGQVDLKWD